MIDKESGRESGRKTRDVVFNSGDATHFIPFEAIDVVLKKNEEMTETEMIQALGNIADLANADLLDTYFIACMVAQMSDHFELVGTHDFVYLGLETEPEPEAQ